MTNLKFSYLLKKYASDLATREEVVELFALLEMSDNDEELKKAIEASLANEITAIASLDQHWNKIWSAIEQRVNKM